MPRRSNREHLENLVEASAARTWERPERKRLFILFTPRSGSSWFGDLLRSTRVLGNPEEFLNQDTNSEVVRRFATRTEIDYLNALETVTASGNGLFSIEAVWGHVELCGFDLLHYYGDAHFVYLRRRDILAQAISLLLATETGVYHNPTGGAGEAQTGAADRLVSPEKTFATIRRWWGHLMNYECQAEIQFAIRGIRPLRLTYEDIVGDPPGTVQQVREFCAIPPEAGGPPSSSYAPVGGRANAELAEQFLHAEPEFVARMTAFRPPLA